MNKLIDSDGNVLEVGDRFRIYFPKDCGFGGLGTLREVAQYFDENVELKYVEAAHVTWDCMRVSYYNVFEKVRDICGQRRFRFE